MALPWSAISPTSARCGDKHKVLQVLTNLLRNAKYAVDEIPIEPKLVSVSITTDGAGFALVVVETTESDPPENITRIFGHGFTTRRDGHGFGLHSARSRRRRWAAVWRSTAMDSAREPYLLFAIPLAVTRPFAVPGGVCQSVEALTIGAF